MARAEFGKPFAGNERLYVYNQMYGLMRSEEKPTASDKKRTKPAKPARGSRPPATWDDSSRIPPSGGAFTPWVARALLADLATVPQTLASIPAETRMALIHHLSA